MFSSWRRMLRLAEWAVRDVLEEAGLRAAFFTGAESSKLRERALVDFHDDPSVAVLFLTDAGGVGLNLQRAASACIQLELPWNPAVMEQRLGRIHRHGQTRAIDVFHLVSEGGIESRIADLIGHKRALFAGLFEGTTDEITFDGRASLVEQLRTVLEPGPDGAEPIDAEPVLDVAPLVDVAEPTDAEPVLGVEQVIDVEPAFDLPHPPLEPPSFRTPEPTPAPRTSPFQIHRRDDGSLAIDVPPALAAPLAELLASLAEALVATHPPRS